MASRFYFADMKRAFFLIGISLCLLRLPASAQDATRAALAASQQESEERYKRMAADLESLRDANMVLQKRVASLEEELQKTRAEVAHQANNSNVQDDLKKLAERIQEVDKKRESDKEVISEEIKTSIAKLKNAVLANGGGTARSAPQKTVTPEADASNAETFTYEIKPNNTLGAIVMAYNEEFKKKGWKTITKKQVMAANPNVNWDRLLIGQKILIPKPAGAN